MSTVAAIAVLRAAYPGKFPEESVRLYARLLADIPEGQLVRAVERMVRSSPGEWLPSIAAIRRSVAADLLGLPDRDEAWAWASDSSRTLKGQAPQALIDAVDGQGGRWNILHAENQTIVKSQFLHDYDTACERSLQRAAAAPGCLLPATMAPTLAALPPTLRVPLRPLLTWWSVRGRPPTDDEKHDAIMVLRDHPDDEDLQVVALAMLDTAR